MSIFSKILSFLNMLFTVVLVYMIFKTTFTHHLSIIAMIIGVILMIIAGYEFLKKPTHDNFISKILWLAILDVGIWIDFKFFIDKMSYGLVFNYKIILILNIILAIIAFLGLLFKIQANVIPAATANNSQQAKQIKKQNKMIKKQNKQIKKQNKKLKKQTLQVEEQNNENDDDLI